MKAMVWTRYGPPEVLQLREVEKPAPKDNEVLIRILATTVTAGDCEMRSLKMPIYLGLPMRLWIGVRKPRGTTIPGTELAGEIEAAGKDVRLFKEGDQVFGSTGFRFGTCAEYICLPAESEVSALAIKPANLSYEEAAAVPFGGTEALHFLRKANIQRGQKVLIYGAGGSIGTFAVQLARYFGAEVTGVDNTEKLDMLRIIGADQVIDYLREDFTQNGVRYDVIFDVAGKSPFSRSLQSLKKEGVYLLGNPGLSQIVRAQLAPASSKKVISGAASRKRGDLILLKALVEAGSVKPVIDRHYPLEQVAEAHRYVEGGHKKGNVVITIGHDS